MKLLLTLLLVISSFVSSAQINKDSLLIILQDESKDTTIRLEALRQYCTNDILIKKFEKGIEGEKMRHNNLLYLFLGVFFTTILGFIIFFRKRKKQNLLERDKLLLQIEFVEKKLSLQSIPVTLHSQKLFVLNKEKVEKAINTKIGESSWMILNLIFKNPSISNKEIAKEVSLSLEGVSSSLRRMYQAFDVSTASNKKITLIMKAARLSFEN
jgi:hypothetical protein